MKSYKYRLFGYLLLVLTSSLVHAGLTGEFHENNQKKMFFSKKLILPGKENPADFTTEFDAGDRIYGIIYFDGGAADWRAPDKELIDIKVNGKRLSHMFGIDMRPLKRENLSYLPLEIIPNPSDAWQDHADAWSEWFLPSLSDGKKHHRSIGIWNFRAHNHRRLE